MIANAPKGATAKSWTSRSGVIVSAAHDSGEVCVLKCQVPVPVLRTGSGLEVIGVSAQ